ncbi:MAG: transpeptidase family protein [Bacteroidales bacterium]|nr:transpeptidase family protein [Bacteroidales bacterium]
MNRTFLVYIAVLAVGIAILAKAVMVQTKEGDELRALAEQVETRFDTIQASRGDILACDGSLLATDVPIFEIGIDPSVIQDTTFNKGVEQLSQKLAEMYPKRSAAKWKQGLIEAKNNNKRYFLIDLNATLGQYRELETCRIFNKGRSKVGLTKSQPKFKRIHPYGSLAVRTIGYVDNDKLVGLESACDTILRGKDGHRKQRHLHHGVWIPVEDDNNIEAINGNDVVSTLDINIQDVAERALRHALVENVAEQGCAIVMEVATGEIKAITNLQRDKQTNQCYEGYNFALGVGIEPGSTFKLASMLVLLETYPELNINNRNVNIGRAHTPLVFSNKKMYDDHPVNEDGRVTIREVFEQSSNKGTAKLITDYFGNNPERYINGLYNMGLNVPLGTGMAGEARPYIKHPVYDKKNWSKTSLPWMSIGYELRLPPLQILTLYNAVANGGKMMKPQFVKEIRKEGVTLHTFEPVVIKEQIASRKTIDSIQSMMKGVVLRGTAKVLRGTEYGIAGKTGTAQLYNVEKKAYKWPNGHGGWERDYNVTFAGYFPADNPVYSCIVVISKAKGRFYSAGKVAAPVFKEIADRVYATKVKGMMDTETHDKKTADSVVRHQSEAEPYLLGIGADFADYSLGSEWVTTTYSQADGKYIMKPMAFEAQRVPDVKGMNVTDAVYLLENMGWNTVFDGYGKVNHQSVKAGDSLQPGGLITLTLGK